MCIIFHNIHILNRVILFETPCRLNYSELFKLQKIYITHINFYKKKCLQNEFIGEYEK